MRKTIYSEQSRLVGRAVREIRQKAGLTQRELCRRLHREHSFASKCELGERRVDLAEFYCICRACGADPIVEVLHLLDAFWEIDKRSPLTTLRIQAPARKGR